MSRDFGSTRYAARVGPPATRVTSDDILGTTGMTGRITHMTTITGTTYADEELVTAPSVPSLGAKVGAEALGTFILVLFGVGAAIYAANFAGPLGAALAFGIAVIAAATCWGHVSGGHYNPAISLGAAIAGRLSWADLLPYWLAQVVGGGVAGALLFVTVPKGLAEATQRTGASDVVAAGANGFAELSPYGALSSGQVTTSLVQALLIEVIATAVLVGVALAVTNPRLGTPAVPAPVVIGLTLTAVLLVAIPFTNGSVNPARSTAAALFAGSDHLGQLWLFWAAPLLGAAIAAIAVRMATPVGPVYGDVAHDDLDPTADPLLADDAALSDEVLLTDEEILRADGAALDPEIGAAAVEATEIDVVEEEPLDASAPLDEDAVVEEVAPSPKDRPTE